MISRSYYDPQTGLVVCCQTLYGGGEATVPMPGLAVIEALSEPGRHYVVAGEVRELPPRPDPHHVWDLASESWVDPRSAEQVAADASDAMNRWRATATLSRAQFCLAVKRLGMLTAQEAKAAAKGEWPQAFSDALALLPVSIDPDEAEIVWASVAIVFRIDPVLAAVAASKGISDATLDTMFGWQE